MERAFDCDFAVRFGGDSGVLPDSSICRLVLQVNQVNGGAEGF